jgi:hypothetical protein
VHGFVVAGILLGHLGAEALGLIYGVLGNYDLAWKLAVAIGLIAGGFQMTMNTRPAARMESERTVPAGAA